MSFRLQVQGSLSNEQAKILEELRRSRINFTENQNAPIVTLSFTKRGEAFDVNYSVQAGAQPIKGSFRVDTNELAGAGKILAYRLFNVQKNKIGERPAAEPTKLKKPTEKPV